MTDFAFESITATQALALTATDRVLINSGTASQTTVLFVTDGTLAITVGARTVVFSGTFAAVSQQNGVVFADGSRLWVGDSSSNVRDFNVSVVSTGAAYGGDGADNLTTGAGSWLLQGNQGDDILFVSSRGSNTVYGGQGNDGISTALVPGIQMGQFAQGNRGSDTIFGSNAGDTLLGGQGDDRILGNGGQDFLNGNLGDDTIFGGGQLLGEGGNDTLNTSGVATARGGDGDDRINISATVVNGVQVGDPTSAFGDAGNDTLTSINPERDELLGGDGDDVLTNTNTNANAGDLMDGGDGADTITARVGADTLRGAAGNDSLAGGEGDNRLEGGEGDDRLSAQGYAGANLLTGDAGNDTLSSGGGADTLLGGAGDDRLSASGPAESLVDGGVGNDLISITGGAPRVTGGDGDDTIQNASSAGQSMLGGVGNDSLSGGAEADTLSGEAGNDTLLSNGGADSLYGGAGLDSLAGGTGVETLAGDAGDDSISGGGGGDFIFGGAGADRFLLLNGGGTPQPGTAPQVRDWSSEDRIVFRTDFGDAAPLYVEHVAQDFAGAVAFAQNFFVANDNAVAAVQLGSDVIVFSGRTIGTGIDAAIVLVGRGLNDVSDSSIG
jgi:Ca2+-binding RTX toxin-like protein